MDELKRFEEKQKLTNLQIDKRLATIELNLDEIKTEFETISIPQGIDDKFAKINHDVNNIKDEIKKIHEEEKQEREKIKQLTKKYDIETVQKQFDKLITEVARVKMKIRAAETIEENLKKIESLQQQLVGISNRGKLPQCKEEIEQVNLKIKILDEKINRLEKTLNHFRAVQPTIIE